MNTAVKAQERLDSRSPLEIMMVKPGRKINVDRGEFDDRDYHFRIWDTIVYPFVDGHGTRHQFMCLIRLAMETNQKVISSLFAPAFNYDDPRFESITVLHRDNEERLQQEFGKGFDELCDLLNIPCNAQFVETKYDLVPIGWRAAKTPTEPEKKRLNKQRNTDLSRGYWAKEKVSAVWRKMDDTYMIFPYFESQKNRTEEETTMVAAVDGHPEFLFFDCDGNGHCILDFTSENQETWQQKANVGLNELGKIIHEKTTKVPTNSGTKRKKDYVCNVMYDIAIRHQKNIGENGWIDLPDVEALGTEFKQDLETYKKFKHSL